MWGPAPRGVDVTLGPGCWSIDYFRNCLAITCQLRIYLGPFGGSEAPIWDQYAGDLGRRIPGAKAQFWGSEAPNWDQHAGNLGQRIPGAGARLAALKPRVGTSAQGVLGEECPGAGALGAGVLAEEVLGAGDARSGHNLEALPRPLPVQHISEKRFLRQ